MKTEQEVREAITEGINKVVYSHFTNSKGVHFKIESVQQILTTEEVQDLAVIIGKALGIIE